MTPTTPSAPDEVVLDENGLEAAVTAVAELHHRMAREVKVPGYSLIVPTAIRAYLRASPRPAGVTDEQVEAALAFWCAKLPKAQREQPIPDKLREHMRGTLEAARLPSPTDTRERVLEEAARVADEHSKARAASDLTTTEAAQLASRSIAYAIRALKAKPTEAPVEDGWVRVPREITEEMWSAFFKARDEIFPEQMARLRAQGRGWKGLPASRMGNPPRRLYEGG